jgi:hypothetical protein
MLWSTDRVDSSGKTKNRRVAQDLDQTDKDGMAQEMSGSSMASFGQMAGAEIKAVLRWLTAAPAAIGHAHPRRLFARGMPLPSKNTRLGILLFMLICVGEIRDMPARN